MPPNKRIRTGRLCGSIDDQINGLEKDASKAQELVQQCKGRKRNADEAHRDLQENLHSIKVIMVVAEFSGSRASPCIIEQGPPHLPMINLNLSHSLTP